MYPGPGSNDPSIQSMLQIPLEQASLSTAHTVIEGVATLAFALSGMMEAARKRLDVVGVCVVAGVTAFGGGTLRDVLLDRRPFFWVDHANWLWLLFGLCAVAMLFLRKRDLHLTVRAMQVPDAIGLGLFAASGTQIALANGMPGLVAVIMGVISAVFGGVLRDVLCNQIPHAFHDHVPYASCAFAGCWVVVLVEAQPGYGGLALAAGTIIATALRLVALAFDLRLPVWRAHTDDED